MFQFKINSKEKLTLYSSLAKDHEDPSSTSEAIGFMNIRYPRPCSYLSKAELLKTRVPVSKCVQRELIASHSRNLTQIPWCVLICSIAIRGSSISDRRTWLNEGGKISSPKVETSRSVVQQIDCHFSTSLCSITMANKDSSH